MDMHKDQVVTAVVIADSFDTRFRPISEETPRVRVRGERGTLCRVAPELRMNLYFSVPLSAGVETDIGLHPGVPQEFRS